MKTVRYGTQWGYFGPTVHFYYRVASVMLQYLMLVWSLSKIFSADEKSKICNTMRLFWPNSFCFFHRVVSVILQHLMLARLLSMILSTDKNSRIWNLVRLFWAQQSLFLSPVYQCQMLVQLLSNILSADENSRIWDLMRLSWPNSLCVFRRYASVISWYLMLACPRFCLLTNIVGYGTYWGYFGPTVFLSYPCIKLYLWKMLCHLFCKPLDSTSDFLCGVKRQKNRCSVLLQEQINGKSVVYFD